MITGGIPATINEFHDQNKITSSLYNVYLSAILGDLNRYGYKEQYFKQAIKRIFVTLSEPVSWNSFTKNTDIKSHNTVQDYITAMEELYIANILHRLSYPEIKINSTLKKLYILDPFIFHALDGWSNNKKDYFKNSRENILDLDKKSKLIEGIIYNHLVRFSFGLNPRDLFDPKDNIFYYNSRKLDIKFLLNFDDKYYPFKFKYKPIIENSDFFAFKFFKNGVIITKQDLGNYRTYSKIPVSLFLTLI